MSPQRLDDIFKKHRVNEARLAWLKSEMVTLNRWLSLCKSQSVTDRVSLSQAITGMPHGSNPGDPVGRLAVDIASGRVSTFVKQIQEDIDSVTAEMMRIEPEIRTVEIVLQALGDREREVLTLKIIDDRDWNDTTAQMNEMHNNSYSKRTLQRLLDRALDKAYEIVKDVGGQNGRQGLHDQQTASGNRKMEEQGN